MGSLTLPAVISTTVQKKFRNSALVSQWQSDEWWPLQASVICRLITSTIATEHQPLPFFSIVFLCRTSHREELSCTESDFLLITSWRYNHNCSYKTEETWQILISLLVSSEFLSLDNNYSLILFNLHFGSCYHHVCKSEKKLLKNALFAPWIANRLHETPFPKSKTLLLVLSCWCRSWTQPWKSLYLRGCSQPSVKEVRWEQERHDSIFQNPGWSSETVVRKK